MRRKVIPTLITKELVVSLQPENILVNGNTCKVADFGLAREVSRGGNDITYYVSTRW